jgi:hypothetical protein
MRYFTLLICALLVTACANKHQERAVIAGAILGGMIGAVSSQPNTNHAGNTGGSYKQEVPTTQAEDEHMTHEPKHHDVEEAKHEDKQEYNDDSGDGNEGEGEHEKDD